MDAVFRGGLGAFHPLPYHPFPLVRAGAQSVVGDKQKVCTSHIEF